MPTFVYANNPHLAALCESFLADHRMHFIQVGLASRDTWLQAQLMGIDGTQLTLRTEAGTRTWWHHDSTRVETLQFVMEFDPSAELLVCERHKALQVHTADASMRISINPEPSPCLFPEKDDLN